MVIRETNLEGGYILQCRIVDNYDAWKAVAKAFRHYNLARIQEDGYDMYATAMEHLKRYAPAEAITRLKDSYERVHIIPEALYFMAKRKGLLIDEPYPLYAYYEEWSHGKFSPEHILAYCFNLSTPYKMRDDMWTLLKWSVGFEWQKLSKAKRKANDLIISSPYRPGHGGICDHHGFCMSTAPTLP